MQYANFRYTLAIAGHPTHFFNDGSEKHQYKEYVY